MRHGYIKTAAATPYITVADCNANGNEIIRLIREMEKEHVESYGFSGALYYWLHLPGSVPAEKASGQCMGDFAEDCKRNGRCGCPDLCGCCR